jgi:hypothetical protein
VSRTQSTLIALLLQVLGVCPSVAQAPPGTATHLSVVSGVTPAGNATDQWLAMIRKRLPRERYDSVARVRRPMTREHAGWELLIRSRVNEWERMVDDVAAPYAPVPPPARVLIVTGNRGAEDAFTHDAVTMGFDLAALQANYGDPSEIENRDRMDRFFRHELAHLLQKAWVARHPIRLDTPLQRALAEIWAEGLGNYHSLSERWRSRSGRRSPSATRTLAELEPRFVARLAAVACATPAAAMPLVTDLSTGPFDRKWGALPAALWLEIEPGPPLETLRRFVVAGPGGVWELAERHLAPALRSTLAEAKAADSLCSRSPS